MADSVERIAKILFILIMVLASISCLARPDYNCPLFGVLTLMYFDVPDLKVNRQTFWLIILAMSVVQDVIYCGFWSSIWFNQEYLALSPVTVGVHKTAMITSLLEILLKIVTLVLLAATKSEWSEGNDEDEDSEDDEYD
eukprot:Platyproteum_vivax@DN9052_c0_g1_i1.p1